MKQSCSSIPCYMCMYVWVIHVLYMCMRVYLYARAFSITQVTLPQGWGSGDILSISSRSAKGSPKYALILSGFDWTLVYNHLDFH